MEWEVCQELLGRLSDELIIVVPVVPGRLPTRWQIRRMELGIFGKPQRS